jgi:hypothetical protein
MNWQSVVEALPPLDEIVHVCFRSGNDGHPVLAFGARMDDGDGWLWGVGPGYNGIRPDKDALWNGIEADDEYDVTHWAALMLPSTPNREDAGT